MTRVFSTATDNQTSVNIAVFAGERLFTKEINLIGKFHLTGILPAPRGMAEIEVTFAVDINYILTVTAEDKATGNKENITINTSEIGPTPDDLERMIQEANQFAEEEVLIREKMGLRNELEAYSYSDLIKNNSHGKDEL